MNLTQDWIQNKAANPAVFSRAQSSYKSGTKVDYYLTYISDKQTEIMADVMEGQKLFQVQIQYNEVKKTSEERCSCGGFHTKFGACKHVLMTFFKIYADQLQHQLVVYSPIQDEPDLMDQLVEAYETKLKTDLQSAAKAVILRPKIILTSRVPQLGVLIKNNQVPDIFQFANDLLNISQISHGRKREVQYTLQMFEPRSRALGTLICTAVKDHETYVSDSPKSSCYIELTPSKLDEWFDLYRQQKIECDKPKQISLEDSDPPIKFQLLKASDGYELTTNFAVFKLLKGQNHLYLCYGSMMHRCNQRFVDLLRPLLEALAQSPSFKISILEADLGKFLSYTLPKIKLFTPNLLEGNLFMHIKNPLIIPKFYLEAPEKSQISMRVQFCYGDLTVLPHQQASFRDYPYLLRDIKKETEILIAVMNQQFSKTSEPGVYELNGDKMIYYFLHQGIGTLNKLGEVYASESMKNIQVNEVKSFTVGVKLQNNWLHLSFDNLNFDASEYGAILKAYHQRKSYFRLKDGSFLNLENPTIKHFADLVEDLKITPKELGQQVFSVPSYRTLYLDQLAKLNPGLTLKPHTSFEELLQAFKKVADSSAPIPESLHCILRSYQKTGYRWLKTLTHYGFGGILADDMGLGKTIQVIALLLSEQEQSSKPSLVVTPSSLIYNWQCEIAKFAPSLEVIVVRGEPKQRALWIESSLNYDVIITSYDLIRRDIECYEKQPFRYCILDEAHYIKNHVTKNARAVKNIQSEVRFALTGTPIENSLADIWSIFDFILPGYLGSYGQFKKKYEIPIVKNQQKDLLERIQQQAAPFILRRLKTDVLTELPSKIEMNLYCEMEPEQEKLYLATLYQMKKIWDEELKATSFQSNRLQVLSHLTRLRQLCCHPALYLEDYQGESGKFKTCLQLIEDCLATKHKILIFSQFTSMLEILAKALEQKKISYFMLTGATLAEKRLELVEQFNRDETPIFLISLKAGGTGLNLTGADVVIHYDPWWNLSAQNQATDRAHRIGQEKFVQVFKLITKETIEEKIAELQEKKRDLTDAVIKVGETLISSLTDQEIMTLFESDEP